MPHEIAYIMLNLYPENTMHTHARFRHVFTTLSLGALMFLSACGGCDSENNTSELESGRLSVAPNLVAFPVVNVGESNEQTVILSNNASEPLRILSLALEPRDGGSIGDLRVVELPSTPFEIEGFGVQTFKVRYSPTSTAGNKGRLLIGSSDPNYTPNDPFELSVNTLDALPLLTVVPQSVRFAKLPLGRELSQEILIRNDGSAPLVIFEEPAYSGGQDFSALWPARTYPTRLEVYDPEKAQANPDQYFLRGAVRYRPIGEGQDSGQVVIKSNDLNGETGDVNNQGIRRVDVSANANAPCIFVDSTARNLGQTPVGTTNADLIRVQNCGREVLSIDSIRITQNSASDEFELDLGGFDLDGDKELDAALTLQPGAEETFLLKYIPAAEGVDQGQITITSNDPVQPALLVNMVGRGAVGICPTAVGTGVIRGSGGAERNVLTAAPLEYLILDGGDSDDDGTVVRWRWRIKSKPSEDPTPVDNLPPTREDVNDQDQSRREVRLLIQGEYIFGLVAIDEEGFESCNEAEVIVRVQPNEKISIQLTWSNPEDPDESDMVGADVDLHLVKMGPGKWFESPYDVYFRNTGSENDGIWNPESPSLDRDDTDGAGPETIQMDNPANCQWYAVGAHYYLQRFGTAYATMRIFIDANLVYESSKALKTNGQFWDVARIQWDSRQVFDVDNLLGAPPADPSPEVTPAMISSGLCTEAGLY